MTFEIERLYHRRTDIHEVFQGQRQGGVSTPPNAPYIFLFTGEAGEQHGYSDGFEENGVFIYTGEGQRGDMEFVRGNKAIRDHAKYGKDLLLFEATKRKGFYRYKGTFACAAYDDTTIGTDTNGDLRKLIRFQLVPVSTLADHAIDVIESSELVTTIAELRKRAYQAGSAAATTDVSTSKRTLYKRSEAVRKYVLERSAGSCECCAQPAPFKRKNGTPYLEPHHIRQLSDDGLDSPEWVAAICPTCHREIHHGQDGNEKNSRLADYVKGIESNQNP